jgi:hypothetical protein
MVTKATLEAARVQVRYSWDDYYWTVRPFTIRLDRPGGEWAEEDPDA